MRRLNEECKSLFQALRDDRRDWCEMGSGENKKEGNGNKEIMELSPSLPTPRCVFQLFSLRTVSPLSKLREQGKKAPIFAFNYSRTLYGSFLVIYQLR